MDSNAPSTPEVPLVFSQFSEKFLVTFAAFVPKKGGARVSKGPREEEGVGRGGKGAPEGQGKAQWNQPNRGPCHQR